MSNSPTLNNPLYDYLRQNGRHASFPDPRTDYHQRFVSIDEYLNRDVHPHINAGAAANDEHRSIFLTDHGPEHIATVLRRISDLLGAKLRDLTPYETYLLLLATHLHDTGNIFGRKGHERRIQKTLNEIGDALLGSDGAEKRMVRAIAMAHGGYVDADETNKDTIGTLPYADNQKGVRPKLLAALLRFGDELADDHTRTSRFLVESGAIKKPSEVFHHYADRLKQVVVAPGQRTVYLRFDISRSLLCRTFWKGESQVFLFDELKARCLKMHLEQLYCSRFLLPLVDITRIVVQIAVCDVDPDSDPDNEYARELFQLNYTLEQAGYPSHLSTLQSVSSDFDKVSGASLKDLLSTTPSPLAPVQPVPHTSGLQDPQTTNDSGLLSAICGWFGVGHDRRHKETQQQ